MIYLDETIISQYATSDTLVQLIQNMNDYLDPSADFDLFYNNWWNISTANGVGLDNWGRILGVSRVLEVSTGTYFGFGEAGDRTGFNQSSFWTGVGATVNYSLSDPAYLTLLLAKAAYNITNGSCMAINAILLTLFPGLGGYVEDGQNMTLTYTFTSEPSPVQLAIINQSGAIPKPTGVAASVAY